MTGGRYVTDLLLPAYIYRGYDTLQDWRTIYVAKGSKSNVAYLCIFTIPKSEAMRPYEKYMNFNTKYIGFGLF